MTIPAIHIEQFPLWFVFAATTVGFLSIYFGIGVTAHLLAMRVFPALGIGRRISERTLVPGQIRREIRDAMVSIAIFGGFGVVTAVGVRAGWWRVVPLRSPGAVALEVAVLVLWNELHFYAVHRLLHASDWLFRHVHREHHRAIRPTSFSTYAMHPLEAFLLGTVMVLVQPFHDFSVPALLLFPLVSLSLNNLGHLNHDLVPHRGVWHPLAGSRRHAAHHREVRGNYGFLLPVLDKIFGTELVDGNTDAAPVSAGFPGKR